MAIDFSMFHQTSGSAPENVLEIPDSVESSISSLSQIVNDNFSFGGQSVPTLDFNSLTIIAELTAAGSANNIANARAIDIRDFKGKVDTLNVDDFSNYIHKLSDIISLRAVQVAQSLDVAIKKNDSKKAIIYKAYLEKIFTVTIPQFFSAIKGLMSSLKSSYSAGGHGFLGGLTGGSTSNLLLEGLASPTTAQIASANTKYSDLQLEVQALYQDISSNNTGIASNMKKVLASANSLIATTGGSQISLPGIPSSKNRAQIFADNMRPNGELTPDLFNLGIRYVPAQRLPGTSRSSGNTFDWGEAEANNNTHNQRTLGVDPFDDGRGQW
jgi:hypothetical protein